MINAVMIAKRKKSSRQRAKMMERNFIGEWVGLDPGARCYFYKDPPEDEDSDGIPTTKRKEHPTYQKKVKPMVSRTVSTRKGLIGAQGNRNPSLLNICVRPSCRRRRRRARLKSF